MRFLLSFLAMGLMLSVATAHATIYVDADATSGTNDGSSWTNAYTDLQDALADPSLSSGDEIWVAEGTYYPGTSRSDYFQMVEGVAIYGGFDGTEDDPDDRDIETNETILSGDIGTAGTMTDNCYHIFFHPSGTDLTAAAVLSGFTITGAYANGGGNHNNGAGMYNNESSPTVTSCTFSKNYAADTGGGMVNTSSSSPTVFGCTFLENTAGGSGGGGMLNNASDPVVTNCRFSGNSTSGYGGGMYNKGYAVTAPSVTNCVFSGNSANRGGAIRNESSNPSITNCTLSGNTASYYGGAIYFASSSPVLTNCILWGNTANEDSGQDEICNAGSTITYHYCDIENSYNSSNEWVTYLGTNGGNNIDADPYFVSDPDIDNDDYGDLHLTYLSPCIDTGGASTEDTDMDGEVRVFDGNGDETAVVDMGVDEWVDTDQDGLSDYEEENVYVTDPDDTDSDGDGLTDYEEVVTYKTYPNDTDTDNDGYSDGDEVRRGSAPLDATSTPSAITIYVDVDATDGLNDGSSWGNAFTDLQDAVDNSLAGDEIWVAEGIYYPSSQPNIDPDESSPRYNHFSMKNGVSIYGGFYGNETDLDGRDPAANETILSGDFNETTDDDTDNCYHVFYHPSAIALNDTAVLSGFTISGGYAYGSDEADYGGGMYNESSSPTIEGCTFSGNNARYGGGMANDSSLPTLTNCTLSGNYACDGGGIHNTSSSPTLASCTFSGNYTVFYGGGMYNTSSSPTLTSCTFSGNYADNDGGGMENYNSSSPILTSCTFSGNEGRYGGGMDNTSSSSPTLINCTFIGNEGDYGGGMDNYSSSSPTLTNCTFSGNEGYYGGGMYNYSSSPTLKNCILWGDTAEGSGNEVYNNDDDSIPTFYYCDVEGSGGSNGWDIDLGTDSGNNIDSDPKFDSDAIHLTVSSPCLDAGSDTAATGIEEDIDGEDRLSGTVDIGADEFYDSDGDGLSDYMEVNVHYTGSGNTDTDGDGLTDYEEVITYGTDPNDSDSNKDSDTDGDGLTNGEEVDTYGTDPTDSDSDKDSDTDGDGLTNGEEVGTYGTDPSDEDTDGDGYNDLVEIIHNSEPTEADATPTGGLTIYVDADATGDEDGTSWDDAFTVLQAAITVALRDDAIWVAEGTYYPTSWPNGGSTDREMHFSLEEGVSVYGGFDGTEDDLDDRDIEKNVTILSGDIDKDGILDSGNCYHVFYHTSSLGLTSAAVLDGFTVTGGYANGSSPHCDGGGIYNNAASPTFTNCTLSGNSATYGGGMYNISSSTPTLTNCTFSGNKATNKGGGIFNNASSPTLTNCTFSGNTATSNGGGIFNHTSCTPTLTNCTFSGNTSKNNGGGICNNAASPTLTNCTFSGNTADGYGGAIFNYSSSSPELTNCILSGNSATYGGGMYNISSSTPTLTNCTFSGNKATNKGGGIFNNASSPTLSNCTFSGNAATNNGGGICNNAASPTLTNCTFSGNTADGYGGAIFNYSSSSPELTNCILWGDTANSDGDEVYNDPDDDYPSTPTFYYCDIQGSGGSGDGWDSDSGKDGDSNNGNNIDSDPVFVRNPGTSGDDDYGDLHLTASSPCIDKGDPSTSSGTDMDSEDRVVDGDGDDDKTAVVDIGADEFVDSDGDGTADVFEPPIVTTTIAGDTSESGTTATFTVYLENRPDGNVVLTVTSSNDQEGTVSPESLTFTSDDWGTEQTVTVTGVDDHVMDGDQTYNVRIDVDDANTEDTTGYTDLAQVTVSVINTDNDSAGFTVSAISGNTTEAGGTATFNVTLNSEPTSDVIIAVNSSDTAEGTISPSTLTFTSENWNVVQTVTVTGADDFLPDGAQEYTIELGAATSDDDNYDGLDPTDVTAINLDNDSPAISLSAIRVETSEAGDTAEFSIYLFTQPTADVTITLESDNTAEGTVSPSSVTFTPENWNIARTVTVTGIDDETVDGDQEYTIVIGAATSDDVDYDGLDPVDVTAVNTDDDTEEMDAATGSSGGDGGGCFISNLF